MADRPNEAMGDGGELHGDVEGAPQGNGSGEVEPTKKRPSIRWVQLAYDLEQYGEVSPDERGELF